MPRTTVDRLRDERKKVLASIETLRKQEQRLRLALEEAEERPDSIEARYVRADLAGDHDGAHAIHLEWVAGRVRQGDEIGSFHLDDADRARVLALVKGGTP